MNGYDGDTATLVALLSLVIFSLSFLVGEAIYKLKSLPREKREIIIGVSLVVVASLSVFLSGWRI